MSHTRLVAALVFAALVAAGCGSGSSSDSGKLSTATTQQEASGTAGYRAAVNQLFDAVVAARGSYQAAQGDDALRASAVAISRADATALIRLKGINTPTSAKVLQTQLVKSLTAQAGALETVLKSAKLDTARLGDAVLLSNDAEQIVSQINALP